MSLIVATIYLAIFLSGALGVYLKRRQAASVIAHRERVPVDFADQVSLEEHKRAADYTLARTRLDIIETIFDTVVAIVWLALLLAPVYALLAQIAPPGLSRSVAVVVCVAAVGYLLNLPFTIFSTFWLEARFGFNRTTPGIFLRDQVKGAALKLVLVVPLLYGLFALLRAMPNLWWLFGWAALMAIMIAMMVVYPAFIAPLFNKFTPMPDGPMKTRIEALLAKCGFESKGLFVMDASKRSAHGNAYFSGLGKAKRIVFFDTLLEKHTPEEIESILAHELGHYKLGHIAQLIAQSAALTFLGFAVLHWAFSAGGLANQFDLPDDPGLVLVIILTAMGPVLHLLSPLTSWLSRRAEFQADAFAKKMVGAQPMISALTRLSRDNLSTLTPDRLYALFYYSHPPVPLRIAQLKVV
ncbi:M48 family metallopeptidase [Methylocapsa polymorpha]|uniref:M48 family metallopeptidase n=1 Tax=Methylocapsa polymorpha TaxID=3080828 RepID=A0ABZ0HPR4_9HYPH|nr:M48 family metallopeptidase [Methylocapsa sp. RX1]